MNNRFYVILLDVIGSKKATNRSLITEKLNDGIKKINIEFKQQLFAPFEITQGDEVAAVLYSIEEAFPIITHFIDFLSPVTIRTVIAFDKLTAGLNTHRSTIIDGPAFYMANTLMQTIKKMNKYFTISSHSKALDKTLESFFNLYLKDWYQLSELQKKIIRLYQKEKNQVEVAKILERTQQQIQHTLMKCKWEIINAAELTISELFQQIEEQKK